MYENKCLSITEIGEHNETSYRVNTKLAKLDWYALNIYIDYEQALNWTRPCPVLITDLEYNC